MEKYDVISVVGEGSYGLVMRCRHRDSGQYVAIKKFLETEDDPSVRKMAMREIRMLKKLRHENLVNMIEVFRRKKRFFLVFEYLEHTVLEELEARSGGLGFVTSRKYCYQVLRALDFIHSHDVLHRDVKPENVLVSRLGVIKLCDFGFARPYTENETFTDYVATRWYRSPELLVGDGYGKEVDIWAVGCLYAEMMTGEPLFPGESDIDQLFQIVRVLGRLNSRHQNLITRNTMFKGMKQEQNTSLHQLFPDWNRDCLDFLAQCLKMDGNQRPDTSKLLKHDLFTRDKFVETFLVELKGKLAQEMVGNPLLKRMPSYGSGRKMADDKRVAEKVNHKKSGDESKVNNGKDKISQIGLSLLSTQLLNSTNINSKNGTDTLPKAATNHDDLTTLSTVNKQTMSNPPKATQKISINNLVFKEGAKNYRVLSAKPAKTSSISEKSSSTNFDVQIQPPSPAQFQSLQSDITNEINQQKRLSPVSINNLSINGNFPQYFSHKKSSNILGLHQVSQKSNIKQSNHTNLNTARPSLVKRDRPHIDLGLIPLGLGVTTEPSTKDLSPRILPPPPWLTSSNIKVNTVNTHGKPSQITKRSLTDWKSVGTITGTAKSNAPSEANEFLLPNCPGASSPLKGNRKKLSPMVNFSENLFGSRNISASSDNVNET
ncbi:cyclin-dependent kinase-like 4 isoform X2 [Bradysia coprophila]|nr:cyclin-dependent kinase-like 4 isoform X2 [Bradysia coprophila]XP_037025388.1 cyclin-dependent kinase-like 4 isoform X2 [Bradysia coprophila]